jgi:hypothetical protein
MLDSIHAFAVQGCRKAIGCGLGKNVSMADEPKRYVINKDANGNSAAVRCTHCGGLFQLEDTTEGRRPERAFEMHECKKEDASRAAARIVREATPED